ncbi:MAG: pentapeptide repeat-containing protein [Gammaproteobacteria bacterium]|nr:pentapeptide repeat-containing protein [Gammaproteobacteria bacterium]
MTKHPPLYVRKQNKVSGPFPPKQISQSLLLGRFKLTDEVSEDKETWVLIQSRPELVPDLIQADQNDEEVKEKLQAARRWADERRPEHVPAEDSNRAQESQETIEYRHNRESVYKRLLSRKEFSGIQTIIVLAICAGLVYASFHAAPDRTIDEPECDKPASNGIVWRNCIMSGLQSLHSELNKAVLDSAILSNANFFASDLSEASVMYTNLSLANLSYVNFTNANLKGSNLQHADLSHANLTNANLSYVDLSNAKLQGVIFDGVILDNAIWVDGQVCMPGSVGSCNTRK